MLYSIYTPRLLLVRPIRLNRRLGHIFTQNQIRLFGFSLPNNKPVVAVTGVTYVSITDLDLLAEESTWQP